MIPISQLILEDTFLLKTSSTGRRSGRDWSKTIQVNVCNLGGHTTDVMKHMVTGIKKSLKYFYMNIAKLRYNQILDGIVNYSSHPVSICKKIAFFFVLIQKYLLIDNCLYFIIQCRT